MTTYSALCGRREWICCTATTRPFARLSRLAIVDSGQFSSLDLPYRRHLPVRLSPYQGEPARSGHNGGPALDLSWEAWLWRRAHAKAWKPPRRDIALHRLKRAERLGLDYRSYAGVLMNRGTHLGAWRGLPATGRRVEVPLCGVYTFDSDNRLAGEKIYYDRGIVLRQLGVFHEPQTTLGRLMILATHPVTIARALARKFLRS